DFAAYDIDVKFDDAALAGLARNAFTEKTGARGLVNAVERALLAFESRLPSTRARVFPVTARTLAEPESEMDAFLSEPGLEKIDQTFEKVCRNETESIRSHIAGHCGKLSEKHSFPLTEERIDILTRFCATRITDIDNAFATVASYFEEVKNIERYFAGKHNLTIEIAPDAVCYIVMQYVTDEFANFEKICEELTSNFVDGFRLLSEKAGINRFHITQQALMFPESWLDSLIKKAFSGKPDAPETRSQIGNDTE
ncbi:MAG: ATPase, partial [Thermodesulfobacteriota bacterium]